MQPFFGRFAMLPLRLGGAGMITQPSDTPLGIDDGAVFRRKFGFGYVFAHKRRIFFISTEGMCAVEQDKKGRANRDLGYQRMQAREIKVHPPSIIALSASDPGLAVGSAQADSFLRKIVAGPDKTNGAALRSHQN